MDPIDRKRVLIIDNSKYLTGAFKSALIFSKQDHDFFYVLPKGNQLNQFLDKENIQSYELNMIEISTSIKSLILYLPQLLINTFKLLKLIKKEKIEIVHVNDMYNMLGITLKMLKPEIQLIYFARLMSSSYIIKLYSSFQKLIIKYADKIICVSNAVKSSWKDLYKIEVLYDVIEDELQTFINSNTLSYNLNNNNIKILYLSNFVKGKGQDYALEAFNLLLNENVNEGVELHFIGDDSHGILFKKSLLDRTQNLNLCDKVKFFPKSNNIIQTILSYDIVLNCSESESFSRTCLEALTLGKPLISTDSGGPKELFVHLESGYLVENKNITSILSGLKTVILDENLRSKLANNASPQVLNKFSYDILEEQYLNLYN